MQILIDISEHEWEYLNKLVANGDQLGHYERLLVGGEPIQEPKTDIRECGSCKYCKDGHRAGTEECHLCMWESQYKPRTGHWIVDGSLDCYLDKARCHCSECGKKKNFPADYNDISQELHISYKHPELIDNYCPNCGAKMESEA